MNLEEIYYSEDVCPRSINICRDNGLNDLTSIINYYKKNKTFNKFRNCGRKSNNELTELCLKYIENENNNHPELIKTQDPLISIITNLTRTQREIVNSFIEINTNSLSSRSKNAITTFLNGNLKIRNVSEKILTHVAFDTNKIQNVGSKSITEINQLIDSIVEFIKKVSSVVDEIDLIVIRNRFFIEKTFGISDIPNEILESQSIFKLTDFLINQNAIFEKNQNTIFQKAFKIYKNQPKLTLDEIAEELKLSREGVRRIRKSILEDLFTNLQFIRKIEDDLSQKYKIDINQNFIFIDDDLTAFIKGSNDTDFSNEFISYLIYVYISDKFSLLGSIDDVLLPKYFNYSERHNWEYFYLVDREICTVFQFNDFADDIDKRLNERIEETYTFNFKSYLSNFLTDISFVLLEKVTDIAEKIINYEFGIFLDVEDNIIFARSSVKQTYEYAYEALKHLNKPSKVNEITKKIIELHPDYVTDDAKVRSSMRRKNGFVPVGRKSVFGLKKWESEIENFKGGTIRNIVIEYLENQLEPKHISLITSYILKFRPESNEKSIYTSLKIDKSGSFIFFKNSIVGLSSKHYDDNYTTITNVSTVDKKTWEERYFDLITFLNLNKRLPLSSGCSEEETKLYRWYRVQVGKSIKGKINTVKKNQIKEVIDQYEQSTFRKRRTNITDKYNELITFVMEQKRLPSANKEGEENLYHFFYKQRKFYDKGELRPDEEHNFIKVAKIIQTLKYEN